ncbi:pyridoxal phosphate-dependent aminotransferase [Archaeoglobus sp.]
MRERLNLIKPSATLRISALAKELAKQGKPVVNMSAGEPDFRTPQHIVESAIKALNEGKHFYTPTRGIPELLEAIAEKVNRENGIPAKPENVIVTAGAKYAIFLAMQALLDEGDEVILLDPAWVSYEANVIMANAKPIWVKHDDSFEDAPIEDYITSKTKMIVINTPNNPTGVVYPRSFLKKVADLAQDHDLYVLSDEIYEKIIYEGKHYSIASFDGMFERTITVNGFSKAYSMTGWRLGYAVASEEIIKAMNKIQSHSISHPTSFVQYAGVTALKGDQSCVDEMVKAFRRRRDRIVEGLNDLGIDYVYPKGAFYVFMKVGDGTAFAERFLKEEYVAVTPGEAFGSYKDYVRISYATSDEDIEEFLRRLSRFMEKF